jgi:hypothetical protein
VLYCRSTTCFIENGDSAVGIATGYGLDGRGIGVRVPVAAKYFLSASSTTVLGPTQPPVQWVLGALSPGVKRPGREADHSTPTSAEVNWIYTPTPPIRFHGVILNYLSTGKTLPLPYLPHLFICTK